jgi:hypothetical protein
LPLLAAVCRNLPRTAVTCRDSSQIAANDRVNLESWRSRQLLLDARAQNSDGLMVRL